jgi:hypothetical protein
MTILAKADEWGGRSADFTGIKSVNNSDLSAVKGSRWEAETDWEEHRLLDRSGKLAARIWAVGSRWYLLDPKSIPRQSAPDLEAAKTLAISMALGNLPLDKEPGNGKAPWPPPNLQMGEPRLSFKIKVGKVPGDPGPIPDFLLRTRGESKRLDLAA